ncbi:hypothetical protein BDA99DRAFT_494797 [Phascolomyces articulosus]|uniref:MARVEL domain-containing protein n=1 Tax=Phascolomyces articulosus TaxID=60185 RepID=A0AAD5PLH7_9FUNG|nr:hypothetical protein BDA99DRAFT_494797 [Phascolomyces articulosus]
MRARVFWLAFFRFIILILSLATLACHIANIVILMKNQPESKDWFPEHIPYVLYFVGPGVSLICAVALNMVSMSAVKSIRGDRSMGLLSLALMIAVIVYNTLEGGVFPWLAGSDAEDQPENVGKGFATYCNTYSNNEWSKLRCWLTDGAWLGCILIAAFWLFLIIFVYAQKSSDIYDDDYDVYDFKEDVPMAVASKNEQQTYHASSPTSNPAQPAGGNYYNNQPQGAYQEYDSYYDYPPQSPYAGYKQPVSTAGGPGGYAYPGNGTGYGQDDTVHMLADAGQPQYYSPHLNASAAPAAATPPAPSSPHVKAQTPNAY